MLIVKQRNPKSRFSQTTRSSNIGKRREELNLRQARWGERLANYDFMIKYRPQKLAGKPDIFSTESGDSA